MSVYVLGVDGGASSTRALIGTTDGELLGFGRAGPSNHLQGEAGRRRLRNALTGSITAALEQSGVDPAAIDACWLGMTGTWGDPDDHALITRITRELVGCPNIAVGGDVHAALVGASAGQPGVIVYAGTGSIAYALDGDGNAHRTGGWGYLIDDEGGAYHTGRAALTAAFRAADGRGRPTSLHDMLQRHLEVTSLDAVRRRVYVDDGMDRPAIAGMARLVASAARQGDAVAVAILADAAHHLADLVSTTVRKLPAGEAGRHPVFIAGGLFDAGAPLVDAFEADVRRAYPDAEIRRPVFPPIVGSFITALQMCSGPLTDAQRQRLGQDVARMGIT